MKILAIVESLTGNTMSFVEYIREVYGDKISIEVIDSYTVISDEEWADYDKIMIGCYTWDFGRMPIDVKDFIIDNRDMLLKQDVLLFGSGWSVYETYCMAVDGMYIILDEKFPRVKFELRFDEDLETEAIETLKKYLGVDDKVNYKYIGEEFDTRFLVVGKEEGCSNCDNLTSFLQYGVQGEFDEKITTIKLETNPKGYDKVVAETGAMSLPIIVDIETGKHITGFNPPELMELLKG